MESLTDREKELLRIVASDTKHIQESWFKKISDDDLRRDSSILRRLLLDHELEMVCEVLEAPFFLLAPEDITDSLNLSEVAFYMPGGAKLAGVGVMQSLLVRKGVHKDGVGGSPKKVKYSLPKYLSSTCLVYEGVDFTRMEVIKFIANKSGGTHYEIEERKLARMRSLGQASKYMTVLGKRNPLYYELLSMGQALVSTKYMLRVLRKIREAKI